MSLVWSSNVSCVGLENRAHCPDQDHEQVLTVVSSTAYQGHYVLYCNATLLHFTSPSMHTMYSTRVACLSYLLFCLPSSC